MIRCLLAITCAVFASTFLVGCGTGAVRSALGNSYGAVPDLNAGGGVAGLINGPGPLVAGLQSNAADEVAQSPAGGKVEVVRAQQPTESRLQVYSGSFQLSTTDVEASINGLTQAVAASGGYLQSRHDAKLTLRVPSRSFQPLVDRLEDFGSIVSQSIETDDVTDQYQDLGLRLGVLNASSDRLIALMQKAANVDELLQLEAQLSKLTIEIESLKGRMKRLGSQISYSTIAVTFSKRSFTRTHQTSPFAWINQLGPENVLGGVTTGVRSSEPSGLKAFFVQKSPMDLPTGFLPAVTSRDELQAISPDGARVWYREFAVSDDVDQSFWAKAIRTHLVEHRGCEVIEESMLNPDPERRHDGYYQLLLSVDSDRGPLRHLLTISLKPGTLWSRRATVRVTEFTAPPELFDEYSDAVSVASLHPISVFGRPSAIAEPTGPEPLLLGDNWSTPPAGSFNVDPTPSVPVWTIE